MALHNWCKSCSTPSNICLDPDNHRKEVFIWKVDFLLDKHRIRKYFRTKELAQAYESQTKTDFLRGKLMPKEMQSKISFRQLTEEWFNKYAIVQMRNAHHEQYHLNTLIKFFKEKVISSLTLKDGESYIEYSIKRGKRSGGVNRDIHTLKSMFNWAVRNNYLMANPFQNLKQMKEEKPRTRWLTKKELNHLLDTCIKLDPPLADVVLFGVLTGFRKGNLERVTARDVGESKITAVKTKSGKPYDVPISPELRTLLNRIGGRPGPLLDTKNITKRFREIVKSAGLWDGPRSLNTVSLHTLRHTFASYYVQNGGDIYTLQKRLGHESITMTARYAHIGEEVSQQEIQVLNFEITPKVEFKIA